MSLSNEDSLRLNVLCAQTVYAIRINESRMLLTALTDKGEASIKLSPNCRHESYLRDIREMLSEKFLGMPGGYPRHLARWTRMDVSQHSLDKMLLLGEPEAIVALAYGSAVNAKIAGYAWWAHQTPEIARKLLSSKLVAESSLGPELAKFLLEFLPFESRPLDVVDNVRQILQVGLISHEDKVKLWERAQRKNPYLVGFLLAGPDAIPLEELAHNDHVGLSRTLKFELKNDNPYAHNYLHLLTPAGRKWLKSLHLALKKPTEPDVVIALFIAIDHYICLNLGARRGVRDIDNALRTANELCTSNEAPEQLNKVREKLNDRQTKQFKAMLVLAQLGENTLDSIFAGRDATGTVMRKHLAPLTRQINTTIDTLLL